jgi:hypothetical protein
VTRPLVSVLIPTTGRRPELLATVEQAHQDVAEADRFTLEVLTVVGYTWGRGLNQLAGVAQGDYLLTICDDTVPWRGWFPAARAFLDHGLTPVCRYLTPEGVPLQPRDELPNMEPVAVNRSFLLTRALYAEIGPFIDATWYADVDYSERLRAAGYELHACEGFAFTHLDGERDWWSREVEQRQREAYWRSQQARGVEPTR